MIEGTFSLIQSKQEWIHKLKTKHYERYQELNKIESTKNKEEEDNDKNKDYNYLLNMPIWSFCQEKIKDMDTAKHELDTLIHYYQHITEQELWIKDILAFEEAYHEHQAGRNVKQAKTKKHQITYEKQQNSRKRKGHPKDEHDSSIEIEIRPAKTTRKSRNLMEEEVEMEFQPRETRKKLKRNEPTVLEEIKPLNLNLT